MIKGSLRLELDSRLSHLSPNPNLKRELTLQKAEFNGVFDTQPVPLKLNFLSFGKIGYTGYHSFSTWATLRKGDYKLHYDYHGKVELYNVAKDMFEKNDLV